MAALLLLFGLQALICSCDAKRINYIRLPEAFKKGVDVVMEELQSDAENQTLVFHRSYFQSDIQPNDDVKYIYHHFSIKVTSCVVNSTACQPRPVIDCAVCYKTFRDHIEREPRFYLHCVNKTELTRRMRASRENHCNQMGRRSGSSSPLATREVFS